jgi:hypothetical protein
MIDLFAGLGGWAEGGLNAGYYVVGFDNERHEYGAMKYPAQLVVQDVLTIHGRQFKDAALIVASPPCTEYSYMAMPWKRGKRIAQALRGCGDSSPLTMDNGQVIEFDSDGFPLGYTGSRTVAELNALFDACFRIQREASEAAGRHIPMVVENVKGAQKWVGRARWHYGSYYLWGDVPALMPIVQRGVMKHGVAHRDGTGETNFHGSAKRAAIKNPGFRFGGKARNPDGRNDLKSPKRKAASALIAKIPFELSRHIATVWKPEEARCG